jgi:ABC-type transport system substrate-binding protein
MKFHGWEMTAVLRRYSPILAFIVGFLLAGLVQGHPEPLETPRPKPGGVLRIKPYSSVLNTDLDPAGQGYSVVIEHLYEGLVRLDSNFGILPGLAEYWSVTEAGRRITFYLRKDAFFHNGKEVTAEDVKFSFERLFRLKNNPLFYWFASRLEGGEEFWKGQAQEVSGLQVVDKKTLIITWKEPSISNVYFLAADFAGILPKNLVLSQKKKFFEKPVGAGPFKFDYWLRNSRLDIIGIRLSRNENYFGPKPYLEGLEVSPHFLVDSFFEDEVQVVPYLSYRISRDKYQVMEFNSLHLAYLFFSCHLPPFDQAEVRRAIQSFIDRRPLAALGSTTAYFGKVLDEFIPTFLPGFVPEPREGAPSMSRVLQALEGAGLGNKDKPLTVYLVFENSTKDKARKFYEYLRQALKPAGIRLELMVNPTPEEMVAIKVPYLIYFEYRLPLPDPEFLIKPLFQSDSELNRKYFHYSNKIIDDLLENQRSNLRFDRRVGIFKQIENILQEEVPAIPLFYYRQRLAYQPYIKNLKAGPLGIFSLNLRTAWVAK